MDEFLDGREQQGDFSDYGSDFTPDEEAILNALLLDSQAQGLQDSEADNPNRGPDLRRLQADAEIETTGSVRVPSSSTFTIQSTPNKHSPASEHRRRHVQVAFDLGSQSQTANRERRVPSTS